MRRSRVTRPASTQDSRRGIVGGVAVLLAPWRGSPRAARAPPCARSAGRASAIAFTYCDSGRCTNGSTTPGASSSIVTSSTQVRADAPVLLVEDVVDRPSRCSGACSSGWFRRNRKRPPGASTRAISAIAARRSVMCSNTRHATDGVERRVGERQRVGARRARSAGPPPRSRGDARAARRVGSTPTTRRAPIGDGEPGDLALTACRCRARAARRRGTRADEREDLLLVLGVGAVGEPVLPPARVRSQSVVGRSSSASTRHVMPSSGARNCPV